MDEAKKFPLNITPFIELFENQVKLFPHSIAVSYNNKSLSYAELNTKANKLSYYLLANGIKTKDRVSVCLKNSFELIISLLGILKIGGVFIPLSPSYPINHLQFILKDTKTKFLILDDDLKTKFNKYAGKSLTSCFLQNVIHPYSSANPEYIPMINDNAYIIYTSGSTGYPKGVLGSVLGMSNLLLWTKKNYPITSKDNFLLTASIGFSISLWQLLSPLICGAKLVLGDNTKNHDINYLADIFEEKKITAVHLVPALLKKLLTTDAVKKCTSLKWIATGGDKVSPDLLNLMKKKLSAKLYVSYGTSETSTIITSFLASDSKFQNKYCIGKPIDNTKIYLFDENMQPIFDNKIGEIYVGGYSLANGYLNNHNLTQEKFISSPLVLKDGMNLYRTGDLARHLSNDHLEFVGRKDFQIKLNGCRIEPEGIENILRKHPIISDAIVMKKKTAFGSNSHEKLVAWIVPLDLSILNLKLSEKNAIKKQIKEYLRKYLPSYEIPQKNIFITQLPTNLHGKIDRKALDFIQDKDGII